MRGRHKLTVFTTKSMCLPPLLINENILIYHSIVYSSTCLLINLSTVN